MKHLIDKDALVAEIKARINDIEVAQKAGIIKKRDADMKITLFKSILSLLDTLEVKECEAKSGIVQKDLQIILDDGMYIDLDPSMQLKPSFSVKEGEKVKVVISKED